MKHFNTFPQMVELAFKKYNDRICAIAYRLTGNKGDAEDIRSHCFEALCKQKDVELMTLSNMEAFLKKTAENKIRDYWRKNKSRKKYLNSAEANIARWYEEDWAYADLFAEHYSELKEIIPGLPDRQKQVLMLFYFEKKTAREISELLNISTNTVNNTLSDARGNLRKKLSERGIVW